MLSFKNPQTLTESSIRSLMIQDTTSTSQSSDGNRQVDARH